VCIVFAAACRVTPAPPSPTGLAPPSLTPTTAPSAVPTPLPSPTPGPRRFTIGLANPPGTLDPADAVDESALLITRHLYEGLVAYAPGTTRVVPALAETWETSADGLTWTFRLRSDVRFSDGTPLTSNVVVRNFERWLHPTQPGTFAMWRLMFGGFAGEADEAGEPLALLAGADAINAVTVALQLHRADAPLLNTLAMPSFAIVQPDAFEAGGFGAPDSASAGTGPYVLRARNTADLVYLARNPAYWGTPPAPDELVFKIIPDDTQRLLALKAREIEGMAHLDPTHFGVASEAGTRVEFDPSLNVLFLGFNQAQAPWGYLDCRLAVAHALNKPRYVQTFFSGDAQVALAMQPPAVWGYDASQGEHAYDPVRAGEHWRACQEAAVPGPAPFTMYVPPLTRPYLPDPSGLGIAVQSDLAAVGITTTIASPEWQTWLSDVYAGRADLFLLGTVGLNGDPDGFLCPLFCGLEAAFNSGPNAAPLPPDADLAALLNAARTTADPDQREALYVQAHARIFETVPAVPIAHRQSAWAYRADVTGSVPSPIENLFFGLTRAP
jgi:peptide/nickel transport system substrate-binding protein